MKPKLFISSTFQDLIPYRKKLWEDLSRLNVKILGMENFGARSTAPLDTCLKEVSLSDVYIGIIAFRYGSVDKKSKKSFTQLEYEKAIECKKEILIYLFDETGLIQPRYFDLGLKGNKLLEFKKLLRNKHTIDSFSDPDDLSYKINKQLQELLPSLPIKFVRPKSIECKIHRFKINKLNWISFIGYLNNNPIEIYMGLRDEEMFPIPISITKGKILENKDGENKIRYDFQYIDKYGYRNTLGGLNHMFDSRIVGYNKIITKLLRNNTPLSTVFDVINEMSNENAKNVKAWSKMAKKALSK